MTSNNSFAGINFGNNSDEIFKYRDAAMCDKWTQMHRKIFNCDLNIFSNPYGNYVIEGKLKDGLLNLFKSKQLYVKFWAANPPTYTTSYSGSGVPYPNEDIAYEHTPNLGIAEIKDGKFRFNIMYPNSYYKNMGSVYVPPCVHLLFCDKDKSNVTKETTIILGNGIPYRTQTFPLSRKWPTGPMFYSNPNLPIRSQEDILLDSSYPSTNKEHTNFWGKMPPH